MKRLWLSVALLAVLLAAGLGATWFMDDLHGKIASEITVAAEAASRGDWEGALAHTRRAEELWEKGKRAAAAFADHEPLEQVDNVFAQLRVYAAQREQEEYAVTCVYLAELTRAIGESHGLNWWNLL